jgi:hypothetical protein
VKTIKIEVEPTDRTDLLCVRCGGFRTELAVRGSDHVGVHARCVRERTEAPKARPRPPAFELDEEEGPMVKGPVQRPTRVRSRKDFEKVFGKVGDGVAHYIERPQLPPSGLHVTGNGFEATSLAVGAFKPPTATAHVTADGRIHVTDQDGEPVPFELDLDAAFDLSD